VNVFAVVAVVKLWPLGVVTETGTGAALVVTGEVTVRDVGLVTLTEPAGTVAPPNVTVVLLATKSVPVMVTTVPPAIGPELGLRFVTVGAGM
jgi:hypothetical protein